MTGHQAVLVVQSRARWEGMPVPCVYTYTYGNMWKYMEIYGNIWKYIEIWKDNIYI